MFSCFLDLLIIIRKRDIFRGGGIKIKERVRGGVEEEVGMSGWGLAGNVD